MSYNMSFSFFSLFTFLAILQVLPCEFVIFLYGEFYRHIPGPTVGIFHFSRFSVLLAIFQVIQCLCLIFYVFQFSPQNPCTTVCISRYFTYSTVTRHISDPEVCVSHFARFSLFFAIFLVLPCEFLILLICHFSCHIPCRTMWVFHYPCWWVVSPYYTSYSRRFSFFPLFSVSRHIPCHTKFVSHFPCFTILSPRSRSYSFTLFLSIFQFIQCLCPILHVFQFSFHNPVPTVCISHI